MQVDRSGSADGRLSHDECLRAPCGLRARHNGRSLNSTEQFEGVDQNQDGKVDFAEFYTWAQKARQPEATEIAMDVKRSIRAGIADRDQAHWEETLWAHADGWKTLLEELSRNEETKLPLMHGTTQETEQAVWKELTDSSSDFEKLAKKHFPSKMKAEVRELAGKVLQSISEVRSRSKEEQAHWEKRLSRGSWQTLVKDLTKGPWAQPDLKAAAPYLQREVLTFLLTESDFEQLAEAQFPQKAQKVAKAGKMPAKTRGRSDMEEVERQKRLAEFEKAAAQAEIQKADKEDTPRTFTSESEAQKAMGAKHVRYYGSVDGQYTLLEKKKISGRVWNASLNKPNDTVTKVVKKAAFVKWRAMEDAVQYHEQHGTAKALEGELRDELQGREVCLGEVLKSTRFTHKVGALGSGNDIESGRYTVDEARRRCSALEKAVGFTHKGPANPKGKVLCYFKSSADGNDDPEWSKYFKTPEI
eukprot:COSAG04_NODE_664_length_11441_cov_5.400458_3_plen_472_part_00